MKNFILMLLLGMLLYFHLFKVIQTEGIEVNPNKLEAIPQMQPTAALGTLSRINSHLSSLTPDWKRGDEDIPVKMKFNINAIPIMEGVTEKDAPKAKAVEEGFLNKIDIHNAYEIPSFYREGLTKKHDPVISRLKNINNLLTKKEFPLEERNTQVNISVNQNTEEGRDLLKKDILKKLEKRAKEEKRKHKRVQNAREEIEKKIEGLKNVDFSKMYDETYNFS